MAGWPVGRAPAGRGPKGRIPDGRDPEGQAPATTSGPSRRPHVLVDVAGREVVGENAGLRASEPEVGSDLNITAREVATNLRVVVCTRNAGRGDDGAAVRHRHEVRVEAHTGAAQLAHDTPQ